MRFLLRVLGIVAMILILRALLAPVVAAFVAAFRAGLSGNAPARAANAGTPAAELKKDPVCGMFLAPELATQARIKGETVFFCSPKCRDAYLRRTS